MITITPLALGKLSAYLDQCHAAPQVRVCAPSCGVGGGGDQLTLACDAPQEGDETARAGGLTMCLSRDLAARLGAVTIDYKELADDSGFVVESEFPLECEGCTDCCE